jgi:hypothetical protein
LIPAARKDEAPMANAMIFAIAMDHTVFLLASAKELREVR